MNSSKNSFNSASRDKDNTPAYQVKLDKVLGLTVSSNAAIACDTHTEVVVYPAGCTVVIFNPRKNIQKHILNTSRKTITCLALSNDGRYLVTGECGHLPSVRVWDLHEGGGPGVQVAEFSGHKYGINCVSFSPSQKYVVSVGSQHDMIINLWDWKSNLKTASNKVSTKVKALSFSENGNYFVTVGNRHVKFWYIDGKPSKLKEAMPLMGRSAILGEQRNNYFCDVACGRGDMGDSTYAITKTGLLCEFNNRRLLDKWVELRTTSANCMAIGETFIFIGCADGIVRCFSQSTLQFITTLPRTHYLGVNVAEGTTISHMAAPPSSAKYPDTIALTYDEQNCKLTCVYNDHSLYVWDVRDIKRVGKAFSFLFHSACIWGVDMYPVLEDSPHLKSAMPPGSFITCSSDDTIRVWNLDTTSSSESKMYRSNIYSKDLLRIIYIDPEHSYLQDLDLCVTGNTEKNDTSYDGRNGVRSVCISPDGQHMASGDRSGNIRIHSLHSLEEICLIEAHDAEVLSLEYSRPESGHRLLASASRDRLIHVFNVDEDYNFNQTLDDHSSSITAVRFLYSGNQMHMVSCGADKSIIFRQLQTTPGGSQIQFSRGHNIAGKTTLYDMEVDSSHKHVLTACQDRNIRVYNINTGKHSKTFKGSVGDEGSLIKVVLDNSGIYAATSCTDKTLCIYDYYSGECMATMFGHSELVTGLRFTNDCRRLISASGDGCIFIWKVPHDMVITMHARLSQQATRAGKKLYVSDGLENEELSHSSPDHSDPNYRFSIGQLPFWAKKQIADHAHAPSNLNNRQMDLPKGRWAQRLDTRHITVKSVYETDGVITLPLDQDKKVDSDGSKDSSIDSGTELRDMLRDVRRDNMYMGKTDVESTEHDGDVEDYSEGEGESTEPEQIQRVMYYPPAEETGSDYTVNAMDVEELRRSQRRNKKNQRPERLQDLPLNSLPTSISGSQESDDDEDASTPSAETTERNLMSMLSASSESLDVMSQREKYLKSTFESMSGPETDGGRANNKESGGKSISSQYLGRANHLTNNMYGTPRNVEVIKAAKQIRCATETTRKREELQRRIDETRRKLQSVGHSPHLKSSQSISDLSHIPGKDSRDSRVTNLAHRYTAAGADSDDGGESQSQNLRRSCSLSDLTNPSPQRHTTPQQVSGKATTPSIKTPSKSSNTRALPRHSAKPGSGSQTNIIRSTSMVVLNQQSDSESDVNHSQRPAVPSRMGNLMRHTISSQNKLNQNSAGKSSGVSARRRILSAAYSSVNLSNVGNDDSSSEETSPVGGKPANSVRPRSTSVDRGNSSGHVFLQPQPPPRHGRELSRTAREVTQRLTGGRSRPTPASRHLQVDPSPHEWPVKDTDVKSTPLSLQLCTSVADQLTRTADSVVQLHKRLASECDPSTRRDMLSALEEAISETQKTLQCVTTPGEEGPSTVDPEMSAKLQELVASSNQGDQTSVLNVVQQCSNILYAMVQKKMSNSVLPQDQ